MLIVSSREHFYEADHIANEHDHYFRDINLEAGDTEEELTREGFLDKVGSKKILLLIHGYNNEHSEMMSAYNIIETNIREHTDLKDKYDLIVGYSWPSGDDALDWFAVKGRAHQVARRFEVLLKDIKGGGATVDVMSHSLGARVVLVALKITGNPPEEGKFIRNYFCLAPAVDDEALDQGQEFEHSLAHIEKMYIFYSREDGVLSHIYSLARTSSGDSFEKALGCHGPENKAELLETRENVCIVDCGHIITGHSKYKDAQKIYDHFSGILAGQITSQESFL